VTPSSTDLLFVPCEDVAVLLNAALDAYERRSPAGRTRGSGESPGKTARPIHILLVELELPGYFSQVDPNPRRIANGQLQALQGVGWLRLIWQPGEDGHLLKGISMLPESAAAIFRLLNRTPQADHRARLADLIWAERFRFPDDWRRRALQRILIQLKDQKSPTPFNLVDSQFNQDLLAALVALDDIEPETSYRVFSVRLFNDSKRFDDLKNALVRLARSGQPAWRALDSAEVLRELHLVPNPGYLYLSGPWWLVDEWGQVISLGQFSPSVGFPAVQAARLQEVKIAPASRLICIENPTAYYEFLRRQAFPAQIPGAPVATLCLWGNPSPACRYLISCLIKTLPDDTPLGVWADLDYGGFNILAQLREQISPRFEPHLMGVDVLEAHARWARPLTRSDERNLRRISRRPSLGDVRPVIDHMLRRGLKLEQEAIRLQEELPSLST
jgi:hypothetical protein